jgi:hypothetical protein
LRWVCQLGYRQGNPRKAKPFSLIVFALAWPGLAGFGSAWKIFGWSVTLSNSQGAQAQSDSGHANNKRRLLVV